MAYRILVLQPFPHFADHRNNSHQAMPVQHGPVLRSMIASTVFAHGSHDQLSSLRSPFRLVRPLTKLGALS